jgi:hypothetical protein
MNGYRTSLYFAKSDLPTIPPKASVRKGIWEALKQIKTTEDIKFVETAQNIVYNDTLIAFSVREIPEESYYLVSFFPYGENVALWTKRDSMKAMRDVIEFCDIIGNKVSIVVEEGILHFSRRYLDAKQGIDISDWEVSFPAVKPPEKESLSTVLENAANTHYKYVLEKVPKGKNFMIFTQTYLGDMKPIEILKIFLKDFGRTLGPKSLITARELGEKFSDKENSAFIFVENEKLLESWYRSLKVFFDSQRIATQYIMDTTIQQKLTRFYGVRANLILEIMTKLGVKPIQLRPPEEIIDSDGFLCLSSIESATRRLFGALFTYSKEGLEIEEEVQIYPDIEFSVHEETLEIPSDKVDLLSEKISKLIGRKITIDVLLTMEWNRDSLRKLIENLKKYGIKTNRVYYVSSKTSRYVDSCLIDGYYQKCVHPYLMIGNKVAFLKSSTDVRIYANLSSIFIKLMWPEDGKIELKDLEKILWLVKKRMYRIQEFYVLKIPEPIHVFKNVRTMYLGEIKEKLTIPLRLLI